MGRFDVFYLPVKAQSGERRELTAQTLIARAPSNQTLTVGATVDYDEQHLRERYSVVRAPTIGEPIRVLESAKTNTSRGYWLEATLTGGRVSDLREVHLDVEELDRIHFVPSDPMVPSSWLDPSNWAESLYSSDPAKQLRLVLLLRSVLPARSRHEARMLIEMLQLSVGGELERQTDSDVWRQPCKTPYDDDVEMRFRIVDDHEPDEFEVIEFANGPSRIVAPEYFRKRVDDLLAATDLYPSDLESGHPPWSEYYLGQAIAYLHELLSFVPVGAAEIPEERLWSNEGLEARRARPDRYSRSRFEQTIVRLEELRRHVDDRPRPTVRSAEEAEIYMDAHPCPVCDTRSFPRRSRIEADGEHLLTIYEGQCPRCSLKRLFEMRLDEAMPPSSTDDAVNYGDGLSKALDAGQFAAAADRLIADAAAQPPTDPASRGRAVYKLRLAMGAIDEALKFIPDGAVAVPEELIRSLEGWRYYDADMHRLSKDHLTELRRETLSRIRELR